MTPGPGRLDDGTVVTGFLCESIALATAVDITGHGGWLAHLTSLANDSGRK